jgi:hypothetical protein
MSASTIEPGTAGAEASPWRCNLSDRSGHHPDGAHQPLRHLLVQKRRSRGETLAHLW